MQPRAPPRCLVLRRPIVRAQNPNTGLRCNQCPNSQNIQVRGNPYHNQLNVATPSSIDLQSNLPPPPNLSPVSFDGIPVVPVTRAFLAVPNLAKTTIIRNPQLNNLLSNSHGSARNSTRQPIPSKYNGATKPSNNSTNTSIALVQTISNQSQDLRISNPSNKSPADPVNQSDQVNKSANTPESDDLPTIEDLNVSFSKWFYGSVKALKSRHKNIRDPRSKLAHRADNNLTNQIQPVRYEILDTDKLELLTQNLTEEVQPIKIITSYKLTIVERNPKKRSLNDKSGSSYEKSPQQQTTADSERGQPQDNSASESSKKSLKGYKFIIDTQITTVDCRPMIERKHNSESTLNERAGSIIDPSEDCGDESDGSQMNEIMEIDCDV